MPAYEGAFTANPMPAPREEARPRARLRECEERSELPQMDGYLLTSAEEARGGGPAPKLTEAWGAMLLAVLLISIGGMLASWSYEKVKTWKRTQGTVVRLKQTRKGTIYPVVSYQVAGRDRTTEGGGSGYQVGDRVDVLYNPDNPDKATVPCFSDLWLGPTIFFVLGSLCLLLWVSAQITVRLLPREEPASAAAC